MVYFCFAAWCWSAGLLTDRGTIYRAARCCDMEARSFLHIVALGVLRYLCNTFIMIKEFFIRRMLESQLKQLPKDQREKIVQMFSKNTDFFEILARELQEEIKQGKNQSDAMQELLLRHRDELQRITKENLLGGKK